MLPCTRHPVPFCPRHAQAYIEISRPIAVGRHITIRGTHSHVLPQPFLGVISSVTHVFQDHVLVHVDSCTQSRLPSCIMVAIHPDDMLLDSTTRLRQRLACHSFLASFAVLPPNTVPRLLSHYPHESHSRLWHLRRWRAKASSTVLSVVTRVQSLTCGFGLSDPLDTPILAPTPSPSFMHDPDSVPPLALTSVSAL